MFALWNRKRATEAATKDAASKEAATKAAGRAPCNSPAPGSGKLLDRCLPEVIPAAACGEQCRPRRGALRRYLWYGIRPEPMPSHIGPIEPPTPGRTGIACSGGGIRSAGFNLGALQSLGENLRKVDYIAAVSGGSYIASAFAMVSKRWHGRERPEPGKPGRDDSDPEALRRMPPFTPGSPEEQYIRNRSSYMAPGGSDKLFLGTRIVLGLVWNLVFLSVPLFVLGMVGGATVFRAASSCNWDYGTATKFHPEHCSAAIRPGFWIAAVALGGAALVFALVGLLRRSPSDRHRQFFQAWSTRLLILGAATGLLLVLVPALVNAFYGSATTRDTGNLKAPAQVGGAGGFAGLLVGLAAYATRSFSSPKELNKEIGKVRKAFSGLNARLQKFAVLLAGAVLGPLLLYSAIVFGAAAALANSNPAEVLDGVWIAAAAGAAGFLLVYYAADVTSWSLHPFYKRRLASAFALKRVRAGKLSDDEKDRIQLVPPVLDEPKDIGAALERDYDTTMQLSETHQEGWPTLIVCAAANISNPGATPPGRSVTSFTFSANAIGGPLIGGAWMKEYEEALGSGPPTLYARATAALRGDTQLLKSRRAHDLSLPAAVAMSGAAVSPSMGKLTNRSLRFLIALANVRLGVWLPNPRWVLLKEKEARCKGGEEAVKQLRKRRFKAFGRPRPWYLVQELLGFNRVDDRYLYVTDGGHYENLGLVELLRRGCTRIYCFDASGSKQAFKDLGDAVALARSELGVHVYIDPRELMTDKETGFARKDVVLAKFRYGDGAEGTLVYAHNVLTAPPDLPKPPDPPKPPERPSPPESLLPPGPGDDPWDAYAHHEVDPLFPNNSTVDQLYTDQKFESYRVLGEVAGRRAISLMDQASPRA